MADPSTPSMRVLVGGLMAALTVLPSSSARAATPSSGTIGSSPGIVSWDFAPVVAGTVINVGIQNTCPPGICDNYDLTVSLPTPAAIFYQTMTATLTLKYTWSSALPTDLDIFAISPDRKSTRLNSSHDQNSYAVFC